MAEKIRLNVFTLKMIAVISMLIDHTAVALLEPMFINGFDTVLGLPINIFDLYEIMRGIGRLAFPIYCFMIVQGFKYTGNIARYALRLFIFALISELPFDLALVKDSFNFAYQNVFFTLLIGLLTIWGISIVEEKYPDEYLPEVMKRTISSLGLLILGMLAAHFLNTDYGAWGVLAIFLLYMARNSKIHTLICSLIAFSFEASTIIVYLSIPLMLLYGGKKGPSLKYFFYFFYPVHLTILWLIANFLFGK